MLVNHIPCSKICKRVRKWLLINMVWKKQLDWLWNTSRIYGKDSTKILVFYGWIFLKSVGKSRDEAQILSTNSKLTADKNILDRKSITEQFKGRKERKLIVRNVPFGPNDNMKQGRSRISLTNYYNLML